MRAELLDYQRTELLEYQKQIEEEIAKQDIEYRRELERLSKTTGLSMFVIDMLDLILIKTYAPGHREEMVIKMLKAVEQQ